ncbi:MAG: prenyltransferase/squalene oxidase repeat-containing protein [Planctomycetota bacterium]
MRYLAVLLLCTIASAGSLTESRFGAAKKKALSSRGGNTSTEKAVAAALTWLREHQEDSGYWDSDGFGDDCKCEGKAGGWHGERVPSRFDFEVTGLAALAFLGAGIKPGEGETGEALADALDWLAGSFQGGRGSTLFGASFAIQAFAEAYDMTGEERFKDLVEQGVETLIDSQLNDGGWRYFVGMKTSGVPTTTAVVSALWTAQQAGIKVSRGYKKPVLKLLRKLVAADGRVAYTLTGHRQGYTPTTTNAASAVLIRIQLGETASHPGVKASLPALAKQRPRWSIKFKTMKVKGVTRKVQIGYLQHYYWYHGTDALSRLGGGPWSAWNGKLKKALLPKQKKSGHAAGSWDPVGTYGPVGGRVFSTALCTLMLESYYRYPKP